MLTPQDEDIAHVVAQALALPNLATASFGDEYSYNLGLPVCIIDTVLSRGVRYQGTQRVIERYCTYAGLEREWTVPDELPPRDVQQPVHAFVRDMEQVGLDRYTDTIFINRQRTSSKNGILKAEACYRFGKVLLSHGADYLQDVPPLAATTAFQQDVRAIPGQKNALSYFFILCGLHDFVSPGRWVSGFVERSVGRAVRSEDAQRLVALASARLQNRYPHLTPAQLDHCIWLNEREV